MARGKRRYGAPLALAIAVVVGVACLLGWWSDHRIAPQQGAVTSTAPERPPRIAITSSLWSDDPHYTRYALTMGDSLVRTNGQLLKDLGVDMLLITYADIVFTETTLRVVRSVGWTLKEVPRVRPPASTIHMYKENFGRINLWSWIDYDRVVYIDADCLVTGSIEPLLMLPAPMVGAVGDAWCDVLDKERFNAGILSLQPGMPDFVEMIADYRNDTLYKWEGQAEQGLLNWYFKARITRLPYIYNFNLVLASCHHDLWDRQKTDARVVHYTIYKPGNSRESDLAALTDDHPDSRVNKFTAEPVAWWWDAYEAMSARHGWNATM